MFCESMKGRGRQRWRTFFQYAHVTLSLTAASCWRVGKGRFRMTPLVASRPRWRRILAGGDFRASRVRFGDRISTIEHGSISHSWDPEQCWSGPPGMRI